MDRFGGILKRMLAMVQGINHLALVVIQLTVWIHDIFLMIIYHCDDNGPFFAYM